VRSFTAEFKDPYTLRTLYVSFVSKLDYASCVWWPFYDVHISSIERVQRKFVKYTLRVLKWTDMYDLPPYEDPCALICLETLIRKRSDACVMFVFDVLSRKVCSSIDFEVAISCGLTFNALTTAFPNP
jgi:hypothetical protein